MYPILGDALQEMGDGLLGEGKSKTKENGEMGRERDKGNVGLLFGYFV